MVLSKQRECSLTNVFHIFQNSLYYFHKKNILFTKCVIIYKYLFLIQPYMTNNSNQTLTSTIFVDIHKGIYIAVT